MDSSMEDLMMFMVDQLPYSRTEVSKFTWMQFFSMIHDAKKRAAKEKESLKNKR